MNNEISKILLVLIASFFVMMSFAKGEYGDNTVYIDNNTSKNFYFGTKLGGCVDNLSVTDSQTGETVSKVGANKKVKISFDYSKYCAIEAPTEHGKLLMDFYDSEEDRSFSISVSMGSVKHPKERHFRVLGVRGLEIDKENFDELQINNKF